MSKPCTTLGISDLGPECINLQEWYSCCQNGFPLVSLVEDGIPLMPILNESVQSPEFFQQFPLMLEIDGNVVGSSLLEEPEKSECTLFCYNINCNIQHPNTQVLYSFQQTNWNINAPVLNFGGPSYDSELTGSYPEWDFHIFPHSFQKNGKTVVQNRSQSLPP